MSEFSVSVSDADVAEDAYGSLQLPTSEYSESDDSDEDTSEYSGDLGNVWGFTGGGR